MNKARKIASKIIMYPFIFPLGFLFMSSVLIYSISLHGFSKGLDKFDKMVDTMNSWFDEKRKGNSDGK